MCTISLLTNDMVICALTHVTAPHDTRVLNILHTSYVILAPSACRTHFKYTYTRMIIAVSYNARLLGLLSENKIAIGLTLNKQNT